MVFPGTNCEHDVVEAFESLGAAADLVWHGATSLAGYDVWCCRVGSPTVTTCAPVP